jgi:hypothetical protein
VAFSEQGAKRSAKPLFLRPIPIAASKNPRTLSTILRLVSFHSRHSVVARLLKPRSMAPLSVAVVFLTALAAQTHATTVVVARTASEIVIGADSKVTDTFGNDLNKRECKILQVENLFVAFEGLENDRKTGFNLREISAAALQSKPGGSIAERMSNLMGSLVSRLLIELPHLKKNEPQTYFRKVEGGQLFIRIVVAGFEKGRPLVFVRSFRALQYNPGQIGVAVIPDDCLEDCQGPVVTRYLGESDAIEGLPEETPDYWKAGLSAGVRRLIEVEIAARGEYVGPPIDIVRINQNGAQWIQKKSECSEPPGPSKRS